ncbi:MAG: autotransporter domain-containing protein [Maricaulis sp.]|uniref:autotransporter domain-containing protein n=1 Tax=Maricaulis sp. TaxID=1486257 RepID=UPI001B173CD4|nr:autotransporter domain-containing protein [Maricaulis sp.]MBO6878561.1 autotransporter domain-containing protein [Maricaulis sp.]
MRNLLMAASAACALAGAPAMAQDFDLTGGNLYIFGDSLSDTGNILATLGSGGPPVYFNGRFSNGPVWHEAIAGNLALSPLLGGIVGDPSNGINFAHGGARTSAFDIAPGVPLPGSLEQAQAYASLVSAGAITAPSASDVFGVWIGGNNFLSGLSTGSLPDIPQGVGEVQATLTTLADAGAQQFLLFNLPLLGNSVDMPGEFVTPVNIASRQFNEGLREVDRAVTASHGVDILYINIEALFEDTRLNPSLYGFTESVLDCVSQGLLLQDCPDTWSDYDGIHPTRASHALITNFVFASVTNYNEGAAALGSVSEAFYETGLAIRTSVRDGARDYRHAGSAYLIGRTLDGSVDQPGRSTDYNGELYGIGLSQKIHDSAFYVGGQVGWLDSASTGQGLLSTASEIEQMFAALYGGFAGERVYVALAAGQGNGQADTNRTTAFAQRSQVESKRDLDLTFASLEAGYGLDLTGLDLTPFIAIATADYEMATTSEIGPLFAGHINATSFTSTTVSFGAQLDWDASERVGFNFSAERVEETEGDRTVSLLLNDVDLSSAAISVADESWTEVSAGLDAQLTERLGLAVEVGGQFGDNTDNSYAQLMLRWRR